MNMRKTLVASALAVALGGASAVQANTAGLTGVWSGTYDFTMYTSAGGVVGGSGPGQAWTWDFDNGTVTINNTTTFFAAGVWTAHDVTFTDTGSSYAPAGGAGAVNMLFDWSVNTNIPVTETWDVDVTAGVATVSVISGVITAASPVFPGFQPHFTGNLSQVPVPAAVWLMGSGLVGLVGVARRRRKS